MYDIHFWYVGDKGDPSRRCPLRDNTILVLRDDPIYATIVISSILAKTESKTVNHTCYDPPSCKLKLNAFYSIFCKFYVAARGFDRENRFYPAKTSHNTNSTIASITPLSGPSVANIFASLLLERQTPPATYMVQAIGQAWNQSRVNV